MQQITGIVQNVDGQNVKYSVSVGVYDTAGSIGTAIVSGDEGGEGYTVSDTGAIGSGTGAYQVLTVATSILPITAVSTGSQTFTVAGDQRSHFPVTGTFAVSGSTANDGTYTVSSVSHSTSTVITTVEAIPNATADGNITSLYGPVTSFAVTNSGSGYSVGGQSTTPGGVQAGLGADLEIIIETVEFASLSNIYSDNQSTAAPNPFNTNENGYYSFYVSEGATYYLVVLNPDDSQNYALQDVTIASTGGGGSGNISGTISANQLVQGISNNTIGPVTSGGATWQFGQDGPLVLSCWGDSSCFVEAAANTDGSGQSGSIGPNQLNVSDGTTDFQFLVGATRLNLGTINATMDTSGNFLSASVTTTPILVSALPSAAGNIGKLIVVSDSTTVAVEGQTCIGSSTNTALAFSNGVVWKCF